MDFKYLHIFVTVAETGSLTAAAESLHLVQSALSRYLRNIEEEYGTPLMYRGARGMALTDEGRVLYAYAKKTLLQADSIRKEVHDLSVGLTGTLRMGTVPNLFTLWLDEIFPKFHEKFPGVTYEIFEDTSDNLIHKLWDGACDIAVIRTPVKLEGLDIFYTAPDPLAACYRGDTFFKGSGSHIRLSDLEDVPLFLSRFWSARFTPLCLSAGFTPKVIALNDRVVTNLRWAKALSGCAIVPVRTIKQFGFDEFNYKIIDEPNLAYPNAIVTVKGRYLPIAAQNFLEFTLPTVKSLQERQMMIPLEEDWTNMGSLAAHSAP